MSVQTAAVRQPTDQAAIEQVVNSARTGRGGLVVISGGMGCGKTTLLHRVSDELTRCGFVLLQASGSFREQDVRFGVARSLLGSVTSDVKRAAVAGAAARAATALELAPSTDDDGQQHVRQCLHDLVQAATDTEPVAIVVDGCQWVDRPSLQWLTEVSWRVRHMPVVVLVAVDGGEPCVDVSLLDELRANGNALHPIPLDHQASAEMIEAGTGEPADERFVAECMSRTRGNPMLLRTLVRAVRDHGVAPLTSQVHRLDDLDLESLGPTVRTRLRRVAAHAAAVVQVVALLGEYATFDRIVRMLGATPTAVGRTIVALDSMGFLTMHGTTCTLRYPVLRNVVERQLSYAALQDMHGRAARVIATTRGPRRQVAEHLLASAPLAEPWVIESLLSAADEALRERDSVAAVAYLRRGLQQPLTSDQRMEVALKLAGTLARIDTTGANRLLLHVIESAAQARHRRHAFTELASLLSMIGCGEMNLAALHRLAAAGGSARDAPDTEPSAALTADHDLRMTELHLQHGAGAPVASALISRYGRPESTSGAAPAPAESVGPRAESLLSLVHAWHGRSRALAVKLAQSVLDQPLNDPDHIMAHLRSVTVVDYSGPPDAAYALYGGVLTAAAAWQHGPALAAAHCHRSAAALRTGRPAAAADDARKALHVLSTCTVARNSDAVMLAHARLIKALIGLGHTDQAQDLLEQNDWCAGVPATLAATFLLFARGRLRAVTMHPGEAIRDLLEVGERLTEWHISNPTDLPWRSTAALALHHEHRHGEAQRLAAEEVGLARSWGAPGPLGRALRTQGLVTPGPAGLTMLSQSTVALAESGWNLEHASTLLAYGKALHDAGRSTEARLHLKMAYEISHRVNAGTIRDLARQAHAATGGRLRVNGSSASTLTVAEHKVATLASQNLTNREIAAELFVVKRVVEIHLTRSYRKLGISRRVELAEALRAHTRIGGEDDLEHDESRYEG